MENKQLMREMGSYIGCHKIHFIGICMCFVVTTVISFFQPLLIREITDIGLAKLDIVILTKFVVVLFGLIILNSVVDLFQAYLFASLYNKVSLSLYTDAFDKLFKLPSTYFYKKNSSEVINSLEVDIEMVSALTSENFFLSLSMIFRVLSGLGGLFIINWRLALIVLSFIPIKYVLVSKLSKKQRRLSEKRIEDQLIFTRWFSDSINGLNELKLWGAYNKRKTVFSLLQNNILNSQKKSAMVQSQNIVYENLLEGIIACALYVIGGMLMIKGEFTLGGLFAFISYSDYVTSPIATVLNLKIMIAEILPSAERLFQFFKLEEEEQGQLLMPKKPSTIEFKNVSFEYTDGVPILKNFNLTINFGEKIAIVGKNGSGKTTIINLLLRFLNSREGKILFDNQDIKDICMESYRQQFSVVSQKQYLFFDNVFNNINLNGEASVKEIYQACTKSDVFSFVCENRFEDEELLGVNGSKISGGQKQKIIMARAILKNAPIVIFDEATSNYDLDSENSFLEYIRDIENKIIILVTHKKHYLKEMDKIYELENGELREVLKS